ncbi:DNA polymerase III subunit beta [bacterium]|nr:DNA polymerase III subunit beta [bacterium]
MKIRREDIIQNLQSTVSVIEKRQTIPILSNILVKADDNSLSMIGTDLEIQLSTRMQAEVNRVGQTTFSARKFFDICRNLPENAVLTIELRENVLHIQSGRTRFRLGTLSPDNFPMFSADSYKVDLEIGIQKFLKLLQSTSFCMAIQDVRYYLNGLLLEVDRLRIGTVGSNGHRLAMYNDNLDQPTDVRAQFIIPRKGVVELLRLLDGNNQSTLRIRASESNVEFSFNETVFLSKLIDGKFPDFKGALSQAISYNFVIKTNELKNALTRVAILSHEKFRKITLKFSTDSLLIQTDSIEQEHADEEIDIDYKGDQYEVSMNVSYLLEAITNIHHETVNISFTEKTDICLIRNPQDSNLNYVVMPLT